VNEPYPCPVTPVGIRFNGAEAQTFCYAEFDDQWPPHALNIADEMPLLRVQHDASGLTASL
jgi:hypothetical protein